MPALDANVLVRHLVQDDSAQAAAAARLIKRCVSESQSLFVPVTVALELEWVLRSTYGFGKDDIVRTLSSLLAAAELSFESETAVELALALYRENTADFSDCVHVALAAQAGEQPLWTFDKAASKVRGARLLSA